MRAFRKAVHVVDYDRDALAEVADHVVTLAEAEDLPGHGAAVKIRFGAMTPLPLREELRGLEPYGAPQLDVPVRLNVNENPYPPSPAVVADIERAVAEAARDAQPLSRPRVRRAARGLGRLPGPRASTPAQVWAANGSNEVMLQLLQAFGGPGRLALSFAPTYSMYPEYARDTHTAWVVGHREEDFTLDLDRARRARPSSAGHTSCCCPRRTTRPAPPCRPRSSPRCARRSTTAWSSSTRRTPSSAAPARRAPWSCCRDHPNLVVTRTMSKAFALAGARLGYLAAAPEICDALRVVRLPYHLSAVTQAVARAALRHADELLGRGRRPAAERDATVDWLRAQGHDGGRQRRQLRAVRDASPTGTPSGRACSTAVC